MNHKITVHCGLSVKEKSITAKHPLTVLQTVKFIVDNLTEDKILYLNTPDEILSVKEYCIYKNIEVEYFLNGVSTGDDIEPIFFDFNVIFTELDKLNKCDED